MRPIRCWSGADTVVWRVDVSQPLSECALQQLSGDEVARAGRFVHERDRNRYLAGRHALRRLLADVAGMPAEQVAFGRGRHGKPFLVGRTGWHFSFSRRGGDALVGISSRHEIGVDLESIGTAQDAQALAEYVCSANEREQWARCPAADRASAFATCWTRKEASLKAVGVGLSVDPAVVDVGFSCVRRAVRIAAPTGESWAAVESFRLDAGYAGSLAVVESPR
jgi:4'-phosphopantetheinyl transferase